MATASADEVQRDPWRSVLALRGSKLISDFEKSKFLLIMATNKDCVQQRPSFAPVTD